MTGSVMLLSTSDYIHPGACVGLSQNMITNANRCQCYLSIRNFPSTVCSVLVLAWEIQRFMLHHLPDTD